MLRISMLLGLTVCIGALGCSREEPEADVQTEGRVEKKSTSKIPEYDRAVDTRKNPKVASDAGEAPAVDAAAQAEQDRAQKMFRKQLRDQERVRREKSQRLKELLDGVPPEKRSPSAQ